MAASSKKEQLLENAVLLYQRKREIAEKQYKETLSKIEEVHQKQVDAANGKYDEFVNKVEEDTDKRLKIVNKVIDAESEERRWKKEQEEAKQMSELRAEAERKMAADAEAARQAEEDRKQRIVEKKAKKARDKMIADRAKYPIPEGFFPVKNSKVLANKLKRLNGGGRYAMCCFYLPKDVKGADNFGKYCESLQAEYNDNVAWFACEIKDNNFEDAMLLYEFNGTPCVVVCREGTPSNLHRYVIGYTEDSKETLKRYAEKANAD